MGITSNIVFFGTPLFSERSLKAILNSGRHVSLVVTQPDRPHGRGLTICSPPLKKFCLENNLAIEQPRRLKTQEFVNKIFLTQSKLFVVVAYGRILPATLLQIPQMTLNVHASLLPRWRGAAPIARSILSGDTSTGISIMKLVEELDAGDILLQMQTPIGPDETTGELTEKLAQLGARALIESLDLIDSGDVAFTAQDPHKVTHAPPLATEESRIDWNRSSQEIHNMVRAFNPSPGAYTSDEKWRVKIFRTARTDEPTLGEIPGTLRIQKSRLSVVTKDKWLEILEVQREGKERQLIPSFLCGYPDKGGVRWK